MLFWGRRVYWAAVVLLVTAWRQGRVEGATARRVQALFGVSRPTLRRWLAHFREVFPQTRAWRSLAGRLYPPVRPDHLLADVIERFVAARDDPEQGLAACLVALRLEAR